MRVRITFLGILGCCTLLIPSLLAGGGSVSNGAATRSSTAPHRMVRPTPQNLLIDGSKTPQLISDALAYRHFLSAVATTKDAGVTSARRTDAIIRTIGLTAADSQVFIDRLDTLRRSLDAAQARSVANPHVPGRGSILRRARDAALDETAECLEGELSREGRTLLANYVRNTVKSRIRVYQLPDAVHMADHR